ncbi:GNAT family N-acetyltransferase [Actinophytocola sp.]|uniref:GNAT family N-acetyltransferase n=1 Tax=Actinophytocola sp. TaxID=1872138 RepID=UPI002D7E18F1|nr:GNAT family N-acetyltransferase [Actinophytocola sp.]HET9141720.1 GNAT family N-acetyltransferase [Actinophytocola sp.]
MRSGPGPRLWPMWTPGLPRRTRPRVTRACGRPRPIAATCTSWWRRRTARWPPRRSCGWTRRTRPPSSSRSGTHPDYRRLGLARAMLLHGMHRVRAAGATQVTVACLGAPGHPQARGLYYSVGFRASSRDAPLIKSAG